MCQLKQVRFCPDDKTSFGIVNAKSIKNTDTAEEKGYDAGKKVSGINLHIVVERAEIEHFVEYDHSCFYRSLAEKILNRF